MSKIIEERYAVRHRRHKTFPSISGATYVPNILDTKLHHYQQPAENSALAEEEVIKVRITVEEIP